MYRQRYRRRFRRKKTIPDDLAYLGYTSQFLEKLIRKYYKTLICSKCNDEIDINYYNIDQRVKSGPYGLYFSCIKCDQNSPLKFKINIENDKRIKELNEKIDYFHKIIPKVKKNFSKIEKRRQKNREKIAYQNEPFYKLDKDYIEEIKKIGRSIDHISDYKPSSIMEELAELVKLKDERRSIFTFIEPSLNIFDDYININSEKKVEMVYCIKKGYEEKFHKLRKRRLELYKLVDQNNKKKISEENTYYHNPDDEFDEEVNFLYSYCNNDYGYFKDFNNPKIVEEIENEYYKPLVKEKQKRISILKKVFRLTNGYIYVLSNSLMEGLFKVGWTERSPEERAAELSDTGLPEPFKVAYSIKTDLSIETEKLIHKKLDKFRYRSDREFFKTDLETIKKAISEVLNN